MTGVAEYLDALRIALGEVNVLVAVTAASFDGTNWAASDPDVVDGIATLLGLISKSTTAALTAFHALHGAVADATPAPAGERWDYGRGTAPGETEAMSAQDAAIVRRIRELCPDGRYDGGSDAELLQLFRRNKQGLSRSDEDVIAAMTRPR